MSPFDFFVGEKYYDEFQLLLYGLHAKQLSDEALNQAINLWIKSKVEDERVVKLLIEEAMARFINPDGKHKGVIVVISCTAEDGMTQPFDKEFWLKAFPEESKEVEDFSFMPKRYFIPTQDIELDEFGAYKEKEWGYADHAFLGNKWEGLEKERVSAAAERDWRKQSQDLIKNKDGHYNPNRVHFNNHSSKLNGRERSKKKRQKRKRK